MNAAAVSRRVGRWKLDIFMMGSQNIQSLENEWVCVDSGNEVLMTIYQVFTLSKASLGSVQSDWQNDTLILVCGKDKGFGFRQGDRSLSPKGHFPDNPSASQGQLNE